MNNKTKKCILIALIAFAVILFAASVTLSILGAKERIGYLEISESEEQSIANNRTEQSEYNYGIKIEYYNEKVFRSSDIFGVYLNANSLPKYITSTYFNVNGGRLGTLTSNKKLENIQKIENIGYTLKIKNSIIIFACIFLLILLYFTVLSFQNIILKFYKYLFGNNNTQFWIKIVVFLIYVTCSIIGVIHHEPWRDEGQAWLIARDLNLFEIFLHTGVEGHPFLWFYVLKPFTLLPYTPTINIISLVFTVSGVFVLLFKIKKINLLFIIPWLFFSPIFYEYPVIARNYSIAFFLCTLVLYLYNQRFEKPILYTIVLSLFINSMIVSSIIGFILLLYFHYEILVKQKNDSIYDNKKLYNILIFGIISLFIISTQILFMFLVRGGGLAVKSSQLREQLFFILPLISIIFYIALFMLYKHLLKPNSSIAKFEMNKIYRIITIIFLMSLIFLKSNTTLLFAAFLIFLVLILMHKNKFSAFILALMCLTIVCLSTFYDVTYRHVTVFLFFGFVYTIYQIHDEDKKLSTIVYLYLSFLLIIIMNTSYINRFKSDIYNKYSSGYQVADYIKENGYDNKDKYILVALNGSITGSIAPYFNDKVFYNPNTKEYVSFTDWSKPGNFNISNIDNVLGDKNIYGKKIIFIGYFNSNIGNNQTVYKIADFPHGENFSIYRYKN